LLCCSCSLSFYGIHFLLLSMMIFDCVDPNIFYSYIFYINQTSNDSEKFRKRKNCLLLVNESINVVIFIKYIVFDDTKTCDNGEEKREKRRE